VNKRFRKVFITSAAEGGHAGGADQNTDVPCSRHSCIYIISTTLYFDSNTQTNREVTVINQGDQMLKLRKQEKAVRQQGVSKMSRKQHFY